MGQEGDDRRSLLHVLVCIAFDKVPPLRVIAGEVKWAGEALVPSGPTKNGDSVFDYLNPAVGDEPSCRVINLSSSPGGIKEEGLAQVDGDANISARLSQPCQCLQDLGARVMSSM